MSEEYTLYVMVRNDVDSLTPGKIAAQVNHAGTHFLWKYGHLATVEEWIGDRGFGRVIVLSAYPHDITEFCNPEGNIAGIIVDPSFPVKDGLVTHHVEMMTCGYIFCNVTVANRFQNMRLL